MLVALKIYSSPKLSRSQTAAAWQEAQLPVLLASCGVPNICKVHWAFQQRDVIVVVQQYCERVFLDSPACLPALTRACTCASAAQILRCMPSVTATSTLDCTGPARHTCCCATTICMQAEQHLLRAEGNLAQVLSERGSALSERETCCMLVVPMLVTLWHLSQHSILHGDVKLENIFVSNRQAYLGDFGASQRLFVCTSSMRHACVRCLPQADGNMCPAALPCTTVRGVGGATSARLHDMRLCVSVCMCMAARSCLSIS
jgi:serine/threonine protein kinase